MFIEQILIRSMKIDVDRLCGMEAKKFTLHMDSTSLHSAENGVKER